MKTLQQKQKCLEYKESKVFGTSGQRQTERQPDAFQSVTLEQTSDTLSYDSKDPLLSSVKPQGLSHSEQTLATDVTSGARKLGECCATVTAGNLRSEYFNKSDVFQGTRLLSMTSASVKETAVKPAAKTSKNVSKSSRSKNKKTNTPFIEHQEDNSTSFSRANFVTLQERLSADEMHILSQLARALSLPDDVRHSLRAYLDRQKAVDDSEHISIGDETPKCDSATKDHVETPPAVKSKKRKKASKKKTLSEESVVATSSKPLWSAEDVKDPERLKDLLEHTAKLLSTDHQLLLERAVEHDKQMKENAFHDKMASFVELCISTGMVSTHAMNNLQLITCFISYF